MTTAMTTTKRFIVSLRPSFLPGPGLGGLLSSYLEGALYKFRRYIDTQLNDGAKQECSAAICYCIAKTVIL